MSIVKKLNSLAKFLKNNNLNEELKSLKAYAAEIIDFMSSGGNPLYSDKNDGILNDFLKSDKPLTDEDGMPIRENLVISELFLRSGYNKIIEYINIYSNDISFIAKNHITDDVVTMIDVILNRIRLTREVYVSSLSDKKSKLSALDKDAGEAQGESVSGDSSHMIDLLRTGIEDLQEKIETLSNLYKILDSMALLAEEEFDGEPFIQYEKVSEIFNELKDKTFDDINQTGKRLVDENVKRYREQRERIKQRRDRVIREREEEAARLERKEAERAEKERNPAGLKLVEDEDDDEGSLGNDLGR